MRLRDEVLNLEEDITPGDPHEAVYRERVADLREKSDLIIRLWEEIVWRKEVAIGRFRDWLAKQEDKTMTDKFTGERVSRPFTEKEAAAVEDFIVDHFFHLSSAVLMALAVGFSYKYGTDFDKHLAEQVHNLIEDLIEDPDSRLTIDEMVAQLDA